MKPSKIEIEIDGSISKIREIPDEELVREECGYGFLIYPDGTIGVSALNRNTLGDPKVYYDVVKVVSIPGHCKADTLADFLKTHRKLFFIVCDEMYSEYDEHGNTIGKITQKGRKAFEELEYLTSDLESEDKQAIAIDPEYEFYDVRMEIGEQQTIEEAIETAFEMTEQCLKESPQLVADWTSIEAYAMEVWKEYNR